MAGCLIRGRRRWSVTYTSPRGLRISEFFRIWNRRAFQQRKPYQFPGWMKNSPYYYPGRGANPRPPAHPDFITSKESHTLLVRPYIHLRILTNSNQWSLVPALFQNIRSTKHIILLQIVRRCIPGHQLPLNQFPEGGTISNS